MVATTYLAGISGLVKLGTSLCGNPYTDFVTPANLYVATVGRSGQKKTPLEKLLVRRPARELIREMAAENSRVMEHWREQCKESKRKDERPRSRFRFTSRSRTTPEKPWWRCCTSSISAG